MCIGEGWVGHCTPTHAASSYIESSIIHYIADDGKKTKLATLYVIPAREFAREELTEI